MTRLIPFYEGDQLIREVPETELPPSLRAVYLRDGVEVADPAQADQVIPIARIVSDYVDDHGNLVGAQRATMAIVRHIDAEGRVQRKTMMVRSDEEPPAPPPATGAFDPAALGPGELVDTYVVEALLGEGATAVSFRCRDGTGQPVVVK